jgi:hypothetical protein
MASALQTGISAAAVQKYLRGPGKVYKNFTSIAVPGTLLGETKGGSEFDIGLEYHDVEPDGAMGLLKEHRFIAKCVPTLAVNLLEHTTTSWLGLIPGSNSADETPTKQVEYLGVGTTVQGGVALVGTDKVDFSTLEIWHGAVAGATTKATITTDYTVATGTGIVTAKTVAQGGAILDTNEVTATYTYDTTASGDAYTIITPGQIAAADHWTNVALVCELSNQTYTNPYCVFLLKNVLGEPSAISIPGGAVEEAIIKCKFVGFFDATVGLTLDYSPFDFWLGRV